LKDILDALDSIEAFVQGMNQDDFEKDDKTASAVVKKFEIIGEATKQLSSEVRQKYPEVPWSDMAGMRDRLIHGYFGVDYEVVWRTIKERIPQVKPQIRKILEKET
jgi:uncharacterized protein with HEPN domain